jgi:hypothetical protein
VSQIDCITAILAIPAVEEDGEIRDAKPGEAILDAYVRRVEDDFARLIERRGDEASGLDNIWTELLGEPIRIDAAELGAYEKKGLVYPAILMQPARIVNAAGEPLTQTITVQFRGDDIRAQLAELIGTRLGLDWVSIYTTFGPTG